MKKKKPFKNETIAVKLTLEQKEAIQRLAMRRDEAVSEYVRNRIFMHGDEERKILLLEAMGLWDIGQIEKLYDLVVPHPFKATVDELPKIPPIDLIMKGVGDLVLTREISKLKIELGDSE